jgi:ABC-type sugar transport system ATPase subunit
LSAILSVRNLSKAFPGVQALQDVSLDIESGTVHGLMGENGAGKSTLGKILAGLYMPDAGEVQLEGNRVHFRRPQDAVEAGISIVHQELLFAENLTVAENLCLGDLPHRGIWLDRAAMFERSRAWLSEIGANIDPKLILGELPISKQQLVQIAGGIGRGAKILIFDEPTSSLSQAEAYKLLELIRELRGRGVTCVYVSHRLEEVFAICDAVTVLRDGQVVDTAAIDGLSRDALVRMMIGRELAASLADNEHPPVGAEALRVEDLSSEGKFEHVSFTLHNGEILGFAGLVGAGRTELAQAVFGLDPDMRGRVFIHGRETAVHGPIQAMRHGLGLVPEDRKRHGLVLSMTARQNISLPTLDRVAHAGWIDQGKERSVAQKYFDRMRVKAPSVDSGSMGLSGGNQQKLVIAKWLAAASDVLLVDEPTRGVDVGAKAEIHNLIRGLAADGKAVLLISSELPELLALATRIVVMREGRIVGELPGGATEEQAMRLMAGFAAAAA